MKSPYLLKLSEGRELFSPPFELRANGEIPIACIKNRRSALRKLIKKSNTAEFLIECKKENEKLFQNKVKEYTDFSSGIFFPILEKIFREYIKKYGAELPLGEIYVIAPPLIACDIISVLYPYSRLFTVISCEEYQGRKYDEIYFKHGTLIRQMEVFNNNIKADCAAIRMSGERVPLWLKCPILDMWSDAAENPRALIMKDIRISDDFSRQAEKEWGGKAGASLFSLFGKKPCENARISIGEKADRIFLLDTNAF